jgi:hypothetical protein
MNARKKFGTWNAGAKERLEAMSAVTNRGAGFDYFREFMEVCIAHWDAL